MRLWHVRIGWISASAQSPVGAAQPIALGRDHIHRVAKAKSLLRQTECGPRLGLAVSEDQLGRIRSSSPGAPSMPGTDDC
jgi:hypothetical protein